MLNHTPPNSPLMSQTFYSLVLLIEANEPCPLVDFDFGENRFFLSGTCYPENIQEFFGPIQSRLADHLAGLSGSNVLFELKLSYFNSGASRAFMQIFDTLEACAAAGNEVAINWRCDEGDENMIELAEVFEEDFEAAEFKVVVEQFD